MPSRHPGRGEGLRHLPAPTDGVRARAGPEAIIGVLLRPVDQVAAITPDVFARNRVFVDFLHEVIARRGPGLPGLVAEARRQGDGWVYIVDQRTRDPHGHIPPKDIIGVFAVQGGRIAPDSYQRSPKHLILSADGFFRLGAELQACLLEELTARAEQGTGANGGGMERFRSS